MSLRKLEAAFLWANRGALMVLLAAMSIIVFVNVVSRYVTGYSIPWAEEVARHMMIWLTFLGCGLVLRAGGHIAIDNLQDAISPGSGRGVRVAIAMLMAAFFVTLFWVGIVYAERTMTQTTAATEIPFGYIYLAMPVGCVLTLIHLGLVARSWILDRSFIADEDFDANSSASL